MKDRKKEIKEPYEPEETPKPPQIIDPNGAVDRQKPIKDDERERSDDQASKSADDQKQHLLSDDADINDETTV